MSFSRSFLIRLCMVWGSRYFCNSGLSPALCAQFDQLNGWQTISTLWQRPITINNHQWKLLLLFLSSEFLTTAAVWDFRFSKVSFHTFWVTVAPVPWVRSHNWHNWPLVLIIADSGAQCTLVRLYNSFDTFSGSDLLYAIYMRHLSTCSSL